MRNHPRRRAGDGRDRAASRGLFEHDRGRRSGPHGDRRTAAGDGLGPLPHDPQRSVRLHRRRDLRGHLGGRIRRDPGDPGALLLPARSRVDRDHRHHDPDCSRRDLPADVQGGSHAEHHVARRARARRRFARRQLDRRPGGDRPAPPPGPPPARRGFPRCERGRGCGDGSHRDDGGGLPADRLRARGRRAALLRPGRHGLPLARRLALALPDADPDDRVDRAVRRDELAAQEHPGLRARARRRPALDLAHRTLRVRAGRQRPRADQQDADGAALPSLSPPAGRLAPPALAVVPGPDCSCAGR